MNTNYGTIRLAIASALAVGVLGVGTASAGLVTTIKDAGDFSHFYTGTDMHDGVGYQNGWTEFSNFGTTIFTDLGGGVLNVANSGGGAVMFDGSASTDGATTWGDNLVSPIGPDSAYTIEFQLTLNDAAAGVRLWSGMGDGRDFLDVYNDRVTITQPGGGFLDVPLTLNDGQPHTFRLANDGNISGDTFTLAHDWVDGVQLTEPEGNPWTSGGNDARLLFGDYTSQAFGNDTDYDIHYFAYDQGGAFSPIPEPSTFALLGLAGVTLWIRRRTR